jgi:SAM-dependent methyltransferase
MQEIVYHTNYDLENTYWWFVARNTIIRKLTERWSGLKKGDEVLDVGCGTGGFAMLINDIYNPVCMDMSETALDYCRKRGITRLFKGLLNEFPKGSYDIKGLFMLDVLEHIDNDVSVLEEVVDTLPNDGAFIVSVPAYQWMWSRHDKMHMHYRRYTKQQLNQLLKNAGFEIEFTSYFNSLLFLPAVLKRFLDKIKGEKGKYYPVDQVSPLMNKIFKSIFLLELWFLRFLRFPFGLSILTIARKRNQV